MKIKSGSRFPTKRSLYILGILAMIATAVALLWHGEATSCQAEPALVAQVYFDGEYRIADGPWQEIEPSHHISSTQGDVTLRGYFHMRAPDGEYVGLYDGDIPIALYVNHIHLTIAEGGREPHVMDFENPMFGDSSCGTNRMAYVLTGDNREPIEIRIHNPHAFGNENAIDDLLSETALWTGIDFEKEVLDRGEVQSNTGRFFLIVSFVFLGIALFSTLIHIKNSKFLWVLGVLILFAGVYCTYSANGVSLRSDSIVFNTTMLGCSMMLYMFFLLIGLVCFLKRTQKAGRIIVTVLGVSDAVWFVLPVFTDLLFYDMWLYWAVVQMLVNVAAFVCLIKEILSTKGKERLLYGSLILPLLAFGVDVIVTAFGVWEGGLASACVFVVFFIIATVAVLRVVPHSINALAKAKELETEKIKLNAELTESRVSTMISQIRPHFIYNTLGSIEQLCAVEPPKAKELVHNFAKYLRGNFGELDNPRPILMSQEMEHVHYYINIENVRFPDMTFVFEMHSNDFKIPALTIQPIVENAIKHGLMKLEKGGTIRVVSYETDTHYGVLVEDDGVGFDTEVLLDERKHVGIRNIRGRLQAMVNGTLEIESTVGVGTTVRITIPKEGLS